MEARARGGGGLRSLHNNNNNLSKMYSVLAVFLVLIHGAHCFYLPGVAPEDFVKVRRLALSIRCFLNLVFGLDLVYL